jgi:hypothetical protein
MPGNGIFGHDGLDYAGGKKAEDDIGGGFGENTPGLNQQLLEKFYHYLIFSSRLLASFCAQ